MLEDHAHSLMCATSIRVLFTCSGVGIYNRGIETFFREAFDGLSDLPGIESCLLKGAGERCSNEVVVRCIPRTKRLAMRVGRLTGRSSYAVEQWSSFPGVVRQIRRFKPHVIYYSDSNLGFLLYRFRRLIGVPFRLLFSNGGPCHPPFDRHDFVHQVAPLYHDEAVAAGEPRDKHFMIPYGIALPDAPTGCGATQEALRHRLGLPMDRQVILSVGWIASEHKRMDYVIEELAKLAAPRPFLQLLGAMDDKSRAIIELANRLLGPDGFAARSVPYSQVADYYRATDLFVLASLREGFGRVYLEALMHGLPVIAHNHPVMQYVLRDQGILRDLSQTGALAGAISEQLRVPASLDSAVTRWRFVRDRYSWESLRPAYADMFAKCANFIAG